VTEVIPIGVKYQGQITSKIVKYMEKSTINKGYAILNIKAYSQLGNVGSSNDTIKVDITYQAEGGILQTETTEI